MFTNSQKLAAVVSYWLQPAISQIAASRMVSLPFVKNLEGTIINTGLVSAGYRIGEDIEPLIKPIINSLVQPMLENYFAGVPDSAIPEMANNIVAEMAQRGSYSVLGGLVTFDQKDLSELQNLIIKNLPMECGEKYELIK